MMATNKKATLDTLLHEQSRSVAPAKQATFVAPGTSGAPGTVTPIPPVPEGATAQETFELFFGPDITSMPLPPTPVDAMPTRIAQGKDAAMHVSDFPVNGDVGDPRPDLPGGAWWEATLRMLFRMDGHDATGLYGAFHGLRCCDAVRLAPAERGVRVVVVDATLWGPVRAAIVADRKGKAATLDVVLKGVATCSES